MTNETKRYDFLKARKEYQENKTKENLQKLKESMKAYNPFDNTEVA